MRGPGLVTMALGAILVQPRHRESARGFHDVEPVGVVALRAIHVAFEDRMMLGKMEFGARPQVALETGLGILAGVDDEPFRPAGPAQRHVLARRAMAGFAAALAGHPAVPGPQSRMRTRGKRPDDVRVTVKAGLVPHERGAFDLRPQDDRSFDGGTGNER